MKFSRPLALALPGGALPAAAATYQVSGSITPSAAVPGLVGTTLPVRRRRF